MTLKFFRALADCNGLPPSNADWIPSVAPASSALLCAPLGFSQPHIHALGDFSVLLEIQKTLKIARSSEKLLRAERIFKVISGYFGIP